MVKENGKKKKKSLLKFPCRFPIKAIGKASPHLSQIVFDMIEKHAPGLTESDITFRMSKENHYLALTITITATSQKQLDAIYRELSSHKLVLYVL
ncbi:MAG: hypothetical protein K0R12_900 [Gammaproteobacteria bacterium]|jgi:putative lipoic acid-binding regulatory protein|nr:hypothetical protein [Gammaproteobacteria bacterium]